MLPLSPRHHVHPIGQDTAGRQGAAQHLAEAVLSRLRLRQLHITTTTRHRIETCSDIARLDLWLLRATTADLAEDIFGD